jgi:hypothetical protein
VRHALALGREIDRRRCRRQQCLLQNDETHVWSIYFFKKILLKVNNVYNKEDDEEVEREEEK